MVKSSVKDTFILSYKFKLFSNLVQFSTVFKIKVSIVSILLTGKKNNLEI